MRLVPRETQYQIIEKIGEGLNSNVFKALRTVRDSSWKDEVALKVLKSESPDDLWKRELMSLQRVNHPNCVRYLGFEVFNKGPAIVLELVDGISLKRLRAAVSLSDGEVEEIYSQVISGLQALRDNNLCHGDLNFENILIDRRGVVRLIDYGLGNFGQQGRYFSKRWAAPEVRKGEQQNYASDLYSLGAICENLTLASAVEEYVVKTPIKQLLDPNPECRKGVAVSKPSCEVRKRLAHKVKLAMSLSRYDEQTHRSNSSLQRKIEPRKSRLTYALVICLISLVSGASTRPARSARLTVRTNSWVKYKIDSGSWQLSPQASRAIPPGIHSMQWKGAKGSGQSSLTVEQGQHIFINDSFFEGIKPHGID